MQAIRYCKATQRCLVVDWRDSDWTHDQSIPFEYYFELVGINSLSFTYFSELLSRQPSYSVFPEAWALRLSESGFESFIRDPDYTLPDNGACIDAIATGKAPDFDADVVVYPGIGPRAFTCSDIHHIRPQDCVLQSIQKHVDQFQFEVNQYDVVHLRGGTKFWAGGALKADSPDRDKHEQWATPDQYLSEIYNVLCLLNKGKIALPLYILTDTPCMAQWWIDLFGDATLLPNSAHGLMQESGLHKIDKKSLVNLPSSGISKLSKVDLNIEAIRDFVIMNNCRTLVGDGLSLFSLMAYGLKSNNQRLSELPSSTSHSNVFKAYPVRSIWNL